VLPSKVVMNIFHSGLVDLFTGSISSGYKICFDLLVCTIPKS